MSTFVQTAAANWRSFQSSHAEIAGKMRDLILSICGDMTANNGNKAQRERQIDAMLASGQLAPLRELTKDHMRELGIRNNSDAEFARWIRIICFCNIVE